MNLQDYLHSIQGKSVAVIGIGVSNTPLIELLLSHGIAVTACDKKERGEFDGLAEALEAKGAKLKLGENYLKDLTEDIIFRTPGMRPDVPEFLAANNIFGTDAQGNQTTYAAPSTGTYVLKCIDGVIQWVAE